MRLRKYFIAKVAKALCEREKSYIQVKIYIYVGSIIPGKYFYILAIVFQCKINSD
jgi:hypothetical protein